MSQAKASRLSAGQWAANIVMSAAKCFLLVCRTSCDVTGKVLPICLHDIMWCQRQSASHLSAGHHVMSLAKCFLLVCMTSCDVSGKVLPTCLQDTIWCHWQSASCLSAGHHVMSLAKCFLPVFMTSCDVCGKGFPLVCRTCDLLLNLGITNIMYWGSSFMWHQPCQHCKYTTSVDTQKKLVTHVESHVSAVSLLKSGEQHYIKACIINHHHSDMDLCSQKWTISYGSHSWDIFGRKLHHHYRHFGREMLMGGVVHV